MLSITALVGGVRYNLQITTNFGGCVGGEVCTTQPVLAIINTANAQVEYAFSGDVYIKMKNSPSGYESIYHGGGCTVNACADPIVGTSVTASFVNGFAQFSVSFFNFYIFPLNYFALIMVLSIESIFRNYRYIYIAIYRKSR